jgi:hypothetical protein
MELAVVGIWIVLFLVDGFRVDFLDVNRERVSGNRSPRFFLEKCGARIARRSLSSKTARSESTASTDESRDRRCRREMMLFAR